MQLCSLRGLQKSTVPLPKILELRFFSQKLTSWVNIVILLLSACVRSRAWRKKFPAMAEVGMKSPPAGPGRDGFASPHSSSCFQFPFPFLYPPSEVRIWRFGQILTSLERFRVLIAKFGILSTQRIPGLGILSTQRIPEIGILSTQRIPGLRGLFT